VRNSATSSGPHGSSSPVACVAAAGAADWEIMDPIRIPNAMLAMTTTGIFTLELLTRRDPP